MADVQEHLRKIAQTLAALEKEGTDPDATRLAQLACDSVSGLIDALDREASKSEQREDSRQGSSVWGDLDLDALRRGRRKPPAGPARKEMTAADLLKDSVTLLGGALSLAPTAAIAQAQGEGLARLAGQLTEHLARQAKAAAERVEHVQQQIRDIEGLEKREGALQGQHDELRTRNAERLRRIDEKEKQVAELKKDHEELSRQERELDTALGAERQRLASVQQKKKELQDTKEAHEKVSHELTGLQQEVEALEKQKTDAAARLYNLRQLRDATQELVESIDQQCDPKVAEKIKKIWQELPPDAFDKKM